ncbi:MAG: hypothetical protein ACQKBV_08220, partial [Puniceicoccales bacterium]
VAQVELACARNQRARAVRQALTGAVSERREQRAAHYKARGNLVRPFCTIWSIPGLSDGGAGKADHERLEWATAQVPELTKTIIRVANERREEMVSMGITDTALSRPRGPNLGPITGSLIRYARDRYAVDHGVESRRPELRACRMAWFESLLNGKARAADFR